MKTIEQLIQHAKFLTELAQTSMRQGMRGAAVRAMQDAQESLDCATRSLRIQSRTDAIARYQPRAKEGR